MNMTTGRQIDGEMDTGKNADRQTERKIHYNIIVPEISSVHCCSLL